MILLLIFLSLYLGNVFTYSLLAFLIVAIVFLLFVLKRFRFRPFILCFLIIGLSALCTHIKLSSPNTNSFDGFVYSTKENYFLLNSRGERLYVHLKNHNYELGDYLSINGEKEELDFTVLESGFDFKDYLNKRGVYHAVNVKNVEVKWHNFIRINETRQKVLSHFNQEERSIIGAILFSEGEESETSTSLKNLHLARFLSATGFYVSLFALGLSYILKLFLKDKYADGITWILLLFYMVFTLPRFSVFRVTFILLLKWINNYLLKKKFSYLEILSFAGIVCLLFDRYLALQDSFILGFFIPIISYLIRDIYSSHKIRAYLVKALSIYLFFIPFEALYYNKIVILSFPLQIVSTPLFLLIAITSLFCFFKIPLYGFDKFLITLLKGYSSFIKPLSFGLLMPSFNVGLVFIYYAIYIVYLYYLSIGFRPLHRGLAISLVVLSLFYSLPIENRFTEEVNFVNVGQGDCALIRYHQKVILIDTGGLTYTDLANGNLIPYLRKKRIYRIDTVIITHYDYDHYGALTNLAKEYRINNIYDYNSSFPVNVGHLTFNNYNTYGQPNKEENDRSLVIGFNLCNKDFLVMGDAPKWVEKEIINNNVSIPCDVLRVGHHGSDTSSLEEFITFVNPEEAVISVGKNNRYGHPSPSVLAVLNKYQIKIRRTDLEGTIKYVQLSI